MRLGHMVSAVAIATILLGCAPRAAYVGPVATFSMQTEKLGGVVSTELARFNTDRRAAYLRFEVYKKIQGVRNNDPPANAIDTLEVYLCKPHEKAAGLADNARFLTEVSGALKNVSTAPDKDTMKLLGALFKSYDIKVAPPTGAVPSAQCLADVKSFPTGAFPQARPEFSPTALVGGVKELWRVFDSLANAALQQVDEGRRAAALRAYLGDPENIKQLKASISDNVAFLDAAYTERRHLDVFAASRAHGALKTKLAKLDLNSIDSCKAYLAAPGGGPMIEAPGFQACFANIWSAIEPEAAKLLTAAAAYDKDATASPTKAGEELNKTLVKLADLAAGRMTTSEIGQMLEALANAAMTIEALADKVGDEETEKVVNDALGKIGDSV